MLLIEVDDDDDQEVEVKGLSEADLLLTEAHESG